VLIALHSACGSPEATSEFVFTPEAYTVETLGDGTRAARSVDGNGARYEADRVIAKVERDQLDDFREWASEMDFKVRVIVDRLPISDAAVIEVVVPPGAARAALPLILNQEVVSADLSYVIEAQDAGSQ
jgi:hypothetical protein